MWYWFNTSTQQWIECSESDKIEIEYIQHLSKSREGQLVYHGFGNGYTACIGFDNMQTYCGSGRCMLKHGNEIDPLHMSYTLKREI